MRLIISLLTLISLTLLTTACGWHLRGVMPLPAAYKVMYLDSRAGSEIDRQLQLQLEFNGVVLTQSSDDALVILKVQPVEIERRTLSVASSGQVAEYELNGRLQATLLQPGSNQESELEVKSRRILSNDVNNVVGTNTAEKQQRTEIQRELVRKLLRRLQALEARSADTEDQPGEATAEPVSQT